MTSFDDADCEYVEAAYIEGDVEVLNRALTSHEVMERYKAGAIPKPPSVPNNGALTNGS